MPSLRKRVSSYFRQLSFHNEPRDKRHNINENTFVTKYLQGHIQVREGPQIIYGKNPTDLPNYELTKFDAGPSTVIGCYSGPNGGLTAVKRIEKHLSVLDADIDFIDTQEEAQVVETEALSLKKSPQRISGQPIDNTTMVIKVAGQEYCVTNRPKKSHNKSHSLGSLSDFKIEIEKTKIDHRGGASSNSNNNCSQVQCKNVEHLEGDVQNHCDNQKESIKQDTESKPIRNRSSKSRSRVEAQTKPKINSDRKSNYALTKSKSEGAPFHQKKGRIIKIAQRPQNTDEATIGESSLSSLVVDDSALPSDWNRKSDFYYGISDSLYDRNQVTKNKNGDPIADCFGIIARNDSAILAVADGVNWGEKASVAAKSAVHGSLHYLNKTIFHDTKPFANLTIKSDESVASSDQTLNDNLISNTREVFVCLLRAFNCAHDLILENKGMLTTLTVAVVLPLRRQTATDTNEYVCCVCNVGDTLAYVYSHRYGVRELTKGSHDICSNRDMRDALGALGPVDGINPELSNLTLSITTLEKGDIVLVASDGLTDNFDPNVCKFTVNASEPAKPKRNVLVSNNKPVRKIPMVQPQQNVQKPPVKPPRRSKVNNGEASDKTTAPALETHFDNNIAKPEVDYDNPLIAQFIRENSVEEKKKPVVIENKASSLRKQVASTRTLESNSNSAYKFLRSKTALDFRSNSLNAAAKSIVRNEDGVPFVTPMQRYELQLLLMEDILKNGISGRDKTCTSARRLCENLVSYTISISSAKRHTLEDPDLYFDNRNGILVEVSQQEKKLRRKKGLEKVQSLPGKLDHVSIVAYNVGNVAN